MNTKQRLELHWIGKDNRRHVEPRILLEGPERSYHAQRGITESDSFDNRLIFGDNLIALSALEQEFAGKVKCVFIDPPYNTGSAFTHYEDGVEHSLWLSLMRDRLEILARLMANEGSLWITVDDNEAHYLKVLCDEVLGRSNFVANVVWEKKYAPQNNAIWLSDSHDHVLVYAKQKEAWRPFPLPRTEEMNARYRNPDRDPRGPWKPGDVLASLTGGQRGAQFARTGVSSNIYQIETPSGRKVSPPAGTCWRYSQRRFRELVEDNRIWFGPDGSNVPAIKRFLSEVGEGVVSKTIWFRAEVGDNQEAKREVTAFNRTDVFPTPKPERLLQRVLLLATKRGDLVLDSFAGSGTTGAVAHKMGRRWIMVELREHCHTHIIPRLKKVIDGEDAGGITDAVGWKGGGGFRYYRLASSLLGKDRWGNWVINPSYNAAMLAEAVCKLMGFVYAPDDTHYWMQGRSSESDFIYVTTQSLTHDQLRAISEEVGETRTLLICCKAFRANVDAFPNLTVRKIPQAVLRKCEWGKDDYSLSVARLTAAEPDQDVAPEPPAVAAPAGKPPQSDLFVAAGE